MKKIFNIFLTTFIILLESLLFSKVNADKIRLLYECEYDTSNAKNLQRYLDDPNTKYTINSDKWIFYFTDVEVKKKKNWVNTRLMSFPNYGKSIATVELAEIYGVLEVNPNSTNTLDNTFDKITKETRECPKYLVFKDSGQTNKEGKKYNILYTQSFTNNLSSDIDGYFELNESTSHHYDAYTDEILWTADNPSTNNECGNLHMELKINSSNRLSISYRQTDASGQHQIGNAINNLEIDWATGATHKPSGKDEFYKGGKALTNQAGFARLIAIANGNFDTIKRYSGGYVIYEKLTLSVKRSPKGKPKGDVEWADMGTIGKWCVLDEPKECQESKTPEFNSILKKIDAYFDSSVGDFSDYSRLEQNISSGKTFYSWYRKGQDFISCEDIAEYTKNSNPEMIESIADEIEYMTNQLSSFKFDCSATTEKYQKTIDEYKAKVNGRATYIKNFQEQNLKGAQKAKKLRASNPCDQEAMDELDDLIEKEKEAYEKVKKALKIVREKFQLDDDFSLTEKCGLVQDDLKKFLNTLLWWIKISAIVLAAILSLLDYIKAAAGSDDKPMAAANKRFMTRIILVIILFLLPAILTFTFNSLGIEGVGPESIECLEE